MITVVCDDCNTVQPAKSARSRCECGGLLSVRHQPRRFGAELRSSFDDDRDSHSFRATSGVWRFGEVVHPDVMDCPVSHPEGNTPLIYREAVAGWTGVDELRLKHEGYNPTGSFKDRGMTVAVSEARRIGASTLICASTGNTSASLAAYAAQAGLRAVVLVPEGQVAIGKMAQALAYGATTVIVRGDFDACLELVQRAGSEPGVYLVNSINPFRIEGQKTIILELLRQLDWDPPDWICVPAGNLGNTSAFGKALVEAREWGLIERLPRLAAIQASGAAPFARAFAGGFNAMVPVEAATIATAIRIGAPASYSRAVGSIRATDGVVIDVSDREIIAAKAQVDAAGVGCEPASAAAVAGARALRRSGLIGPGDRVVAILTGHLLKDPGIIQRMHLEEGIAPAPNRPATIEPGLAALLEYLQPAPDAR